MLAIIAASSLVYNHILNKDVVIYKEHINTLNRSILFIADTSQVANRFIEIQNINHQLQHIIEQKDSIIHSLSLPCQ
jgi:hypothetical protein